MGRRDLAHDIYFGINVNGAKTWLHNQTEIEYDNQTHIIHGSSSHGGLTADTYYFAPYGYQGNSMVMLIKLTNTTGSAISASAFAKANLKLGTGRTEPSSNGESINLADLNGQYYGVETGPGGGHAMYVPIGDQDLLACGADNEIYNAPPSSMQIENCSGDDQVLVMGANKSIEPGASYWWGQAVLFVNDNPNEPQAADFKDDRSVEDIIAQWSEFIGSQGPKELYESAHAEFEGWRKDLAPSQLTPEEVAIWRQSEAVLRMGQVREPTQSNRFNDGMYLAALPPGEWHTGWVRDGIYALVALAMTGHYEEARVGLDFLLGADGNFFNTGPHEGKYVGFDYRISMCRYFGNGKEEGDFNQDDANIETDGWGLVLWAARTYLHYSCDLDWLNTTTAQGDTVFEALQAIAEDIVVYQSSDGLPGPDASIWEVHWLKRQVFTYTAACQIRGLYDFADIAQQYGRADLASQYSGAAQSMLDASLNKLVYKSEDSFASHRGVAGNPVHVDGSTVEMLNWYLVGTDNPVYEGTMNNYSKLLTGFQGYRRLEPDLSLTGEGGANPYDLSEWILLDLRISEAWRRMGVTELADSILDKITESAIVNDNLIPELYDPDNGSYTGVIPMVGYGAGAWMMTQLDKYGSPAPGFDVGFAHCVATQPSDNGTPPSDNGNSGTDTTVNTDSSLPSQDTAPSPQPDTASPGTDTSSTPEPKDPWDDSSAGLCAASHQSPGAGAGLIVLLGLALLLCGVRRRGTGLSLLLVAFLWPNTGRADEATSPIDLYQHTFAENDPADSGWEFNFHGYARMGVRTNGDFKQPRSPYLVDDKYYLSGFAYTRVNETEWAELFLSAEKDNTRLVAGLFSSQFSDWSEIRNEAQWGIAIAFIDQGFDIGAYRLDLRTGMFWERFGYVPAYDTYMFGRTHIAGARVNISRGPVSLKVGYGAHAEVVRQNMGYTPMAWTSLGYKANNWEINAYGLGTWAHFKQEAKNIDEEGSLFAYGLESRAVAPEWAALYLAVAEYKADKVEYLADSFEILHSTGGRGLVQSYLGRNSDDGTGAIKALSFDLDILAQKQVSALKNLRFHIFGMGAQVFSRQESDEPAENRDERIYFKWGTEALYNLMPNSKANPYVAFRYDRVILDLDHESMSFRVLTPKVGISPTQGLDIFLSYSRYSYGENIRFDSEQMNYLQNANNADVLIPDENVVKIQAQMSW